MNPLTSLLVFGGVLPAGLIVVQCVPKTCWRHLGALLLSLAVAAAILIAATQGNVTVNIDLGNPKNAVAPP